MRKPNINYICCSFLCCIENRLKDTTIMSFVTCRLTNIYNILCNFSKTKEKKEKLKIFSLENAYIDQYKILAKCCTH